MAKICIIEECGNELSLLSSLTECRLCRALILRWARESAAHRKQRVSNLTRFQYRMSVAAEVELPKRRRG
jgi:hypothetical protein